MFPVLGTVFEEPVSSFTVCLALGFVVAGWLAVRWAKRAGLDSEFVIDLTLFSVLVGTLGARLAHVLFDGYLLDYIHLCTDPSQVHWKITQAQCLEIEGLWSADDTFCTPKARDCFAWLAFWRGGLTYYGGVAFGLGFGVWFAKKERFAIRKGLDMVALCIPVGQFLGRLGCFLSGCCHGSVTDARFGLRFPSFSPASETQFQHGLLSSPSLVSLPVHPTQLYEALGLLILCVLLWWRQGRAHRDGALFVWYWGGYAALRFVIEFWRADARGGWWWLSTSQWVAVLSVPALVWLHKALESRSKHDIKEPS